MKYIYTANKCPACEALKAQYDRDGIKYVERSSQRLKVPAEDRDQIDIDGFVALCENNMTLPVCVDVLD